MRGRRSHEEAREGRFGSGATAERAGRATHVRGPAALALATLLMSQGCAAASGGTRLETSAARGPHRTVPVYVTSSYVGPVLVYAQEEGGMQVRLGTVAGATPVRLSLPRALVGGGLELRLIARPVGSHREAVTEVFKVEPGDHVLWTLLSPIETSIATLRLAIGPDR